MFFKKLLSLVFIFSLFSFNVFAYGDSIFVWNNNLETLETNSNISAKLDSNNLQLESESGILIEQHSGQILFEHNSHEKLRPASVTKVMSILLIMEAIDSGTLSYTDKIPCTEAAAAMGGSQIWLDVREELTVDEMLKAICVVSANDCTVAMAEYLCGSQEAFVEKMNTKAQELGMKDTSFKNCHGLDEDGHLTSAYDIALMSRELLNKHPSITKYTTIWMDTLRDGKSQLVNTNKLIRNYRGMTGLKTGSTSLALYNLSASATRAGLSLIAVIMKGPTGAIRFSEAQKLLDYGFSNYQYKELAGKYECLKNVTVQKGTEDNLNILFDEDAGVIIKKGENKNIEQIISVPDTLIAPITKGQKVGEVSYCLDGERITTINIIAEKEIKKISLINFSSKLYKSWFCLLRETK
jgi:D-alanyl-D-alanine carboxypeptidase (penicillin-binding protein 5/6)